MQPAWLFDLHASGDRMVLWFITESGERLRLEQPFRPEIFLEGPREQLRACLHALRDAGDAEPIGWTHHVDFWTGHPKRVYAARVLKAETWNRSLNTWADRFPDVSWYNADLLMEQVYGFTHDTFPLMRCRIEHRDGQLLALQNDDDRWSTDYALPPLRIAELSGEGRLHGPRPHLRSLTFAMDGRAITWDEPWAILSGLQRTLDAEDPDVLLTTNGDSFLMPLLFTLARRLDFPLCLDRDAPAGQREIRTEGRSYFSYGRILYQAPEYALRGRWHLDRANSFMLSHDGIDGLLEVARLSRIPVQRIGRRSIGTGITSIQLDEAWRGDVLIPWKKTHPEAWKSARQLLMTDRGGLVYAPETGFHEDVVELDFVAMYPSIMARFNVSPETVNCACCHNASIPGRGIPEIGYTICEKRDGLVSRALRPLIAKRVAFKRLRNEARAVGDVDTARRHDQRQDALKWMLVCCFGYLGYRNARFGRIEAHESVSALSREMLLRAREVCEQHGWRMLHANVDCVWIVKPGFHDEEIAPLCAQIDHATGLTIALEGLYRWLAFLPSRQVEDRAVPTRYFGAFRDGSLKYRGIECRRGDLPRFVKAAQLELITHLAREAHDTAAYRALRPWVLERLREWEDALWQGEVDQEQLVIRQSLSRDPDEYTGNGVQSIAARQAHDASLNLHAGQSLSYVITSAADSDRARRVRLTMLSDADTSYDPVAYVRLLRRAMNTVLWPMGGDMLEEVKIAPPWQQKVPIRKKEPPPDPQLDLFASA
jgi:DNA polymerase-2